MQFYHCTSIYQIMMKNNFFTQSIKHYLVVAILLVSTFSGAQTKLADWTVSGGGFTAAPTFTNGFAHATAVSSISISHNGYSAGPFNDQSYFVHHTNTASTLNTSTAPYTQFTVNLNTSSITFDKILVKFASAGAKLQLRWSVDGYASSLGEKTDADLIVDSYLFNLSTLSAVTANTVTFRLYSYAGSSNPSNLQFSDNHGSNPENITTTYLTGAKAINIFYSAATIPVSPTITSTASLTAFAKCSGSASSAQTFTVSGENLTANLIVAAYSGLEYSLDGITYSSTLSLSPTSGTVASTTVYVRMIAASASLTSGNISITSTGATSQTIAVSGTVNVVQPENAGVNGTIAICPGTTITSQELISVINPTVSLTSNVGGTGGTGNGFFMSVDALSNVVVKSFNVSLTGATPWVKVYYKSGTWTSSTTNASAWILAGQADNLTGGGSIPLNLDLGIVLNQGQTYSFYIVSSNQVLSYTGNVVSTSTVTAQDSYVKMYAGMGQFGVFTGSTYSPRSFTGTIIYSVGATPFNPNGTWSPTLAGAGTYTYTVQPTSPCSVPSTSTVTVTNLATPAAPTVANTSISYCQNATATALSATAAASHSLRWYSVATGGTGATTAITPVTSTAGTFTYYVCQRSNTTGCEGPRVAITVTVSPASVAGTATSTASTICSGNTVTLSLTGNTGTIQWQTSLNNNTWTNITGETTASFTTPALNATTYYRAAVTSGVCTAVNSNAITITVPPAPYPYDLQ